MAGKEGGPQPQQTGVVEGYRKLNVLSRNIALGVAGVSALIGTGILIVPALLWAGGDQIQISVIDRYKAWKEKKPMPKSGIVYQAKAA